MEKIAIIPALYEEKNMEKVSFLLNSDNPTLNIVVINDGSDDLTSSVARQSKQTVIIDFPDNIGIGETSRLVSFEVAGKIIIGLFR